MERSCLQKYLVWIHVLCFVRLYQQLIEQQGSIVCYLHCSDRGARVSRRSYEVSDGKSVFFFFLFFLFFFLFFFFFFFLGGGVTRRIASATTLINQSHVMSIYWPSISLWRNSSQSIHTLHGYAKIDHQGSHRRVMKYICSNPRYLAYLSNIPTVS